MYQIYQVNYGDTLDSIADKFNTSLDELMKINSDMNFTAGSYMVVPSVNNEIFKTYKVKSGDNLYQIAKEYNISVDDLASINGLEKNDYIYPNQEIIVPTGSSFVYVTKNEDTIDTISKKMNVNYDDIIDQNKRLYLVPDQLVVLKKQNM